jgi:protein SCO1/2
MSLFSTHLVTRRRMLGGLFALGGLRATSPVRAAEAAHDHHGMDHREHLAAAEKAGVKQSEQAYQVPDVAMVDQRGRRLVFSRDLVDARTVILNFIYTSCTTVCPVSTQIFAEVQRKLGHEINKVHLVSVSIDPEYDTPARLLAYAKAHGAQRDFYTGTNEASIAVQKAFDAYRGDKMNHAPLTLLRGPRGKTWARLDGFASPEAIVAKYRAISG